MTGLTDVTKDEVLALFSTWTVGLFAGDDELTDRRYQRAVAQWSPPQGDDVRFVDNLNEIRFGNMSIDHQIDHWGVFDTEGRLRARYKLQKARDIPAIDNAVFPPGSLRIGIP